MKNIYNIFTLLLCTLSFAQTTHYVNAGMMYFTPSDLTIEQGDVVIWINDGGTHDINGQTSSITGGPFNNPEIFTSEFNSTVGGEIYTHIFNIPGFYNYDCSMYGHAASGMVGTISVNPIENNDCDGTWIEDITSGDCSEFTSQGSDFCSSYSGCEWFYSWGGWDSGGTSDCLGIYEIDESYCDETIMMDCTLSGGEDVSNGWTGYDTGNNWCNSCLCENGLLACTEMFCEDTTDCISDIDEDGICEDDCELMQYMIVDCECSFFNPNTYTIFFITVDEENCLTIEDCGCACINDVNNNGICDEDEETSGDTVLGWWYDFENDEYVEISDNLITIYGVDNDENVICWDNWSMEYTYISDELIEVIDPEEGPIEIPLTILASGLLEIGTPDGIIQLSPLTESPNLNMCENDCPCINPDWINPMSICLTDWDPVIGCDGIQYSNDCVAAAAGLTSWTYGNNQGTGGQGDLNWCESDLCELIDCLEGYECIDGECIEIIVGETEGCTDETACNYMNSATIDNESCIYEGDPGCDDCSTELDFTNYGDNEYFSQTYNAPPGLIITINFSGSTEPCCDHAYVNGVQYNGILDGIVIGDEVLNIEWTTDGSVNSASGYGWSAELICEEALEGCTQPYAENYNPDANTDDGSCELDCNYLLTEQSYIDLNYDNSVSNYYCSFYVTNGTYTLEQAISNGFNCDCVIIGCTDPEALNYDESAFVDDCSCIYETNCSSISVTGGSYPTEVSWNIEDTNGDIVASGNAPYCQQFCFEDGCYTINMIDSYGDGWNNAVLSVDEYDYTFTTGLGAIAPFGYNNDDCIIEGCTNSLADNYNEEANYDDDSCEYGCDYLLSYESYTELGFDDSVSNYYCGYYVTSGTYTIEQAESYGYACDCVLVGCTDETATNYDETANIDDCSCIYDNNCSPVSFNNNDSSLGWQIANVSGEIVLEYNYNSTGQEQVTPYCGNFCFEDGCYIINMSAIYGQGWYQNILEIGDQTYTLNTGYDGIMTFNYNSEANCEVGCTDSEASNYNENAILDDGSCVTFGCTITVACNYNPDATAFDGSCYYCYDDNCNLYPTDYYDCEGNCFDEDNDGVCDWDEIEGCTDAEACNYNPNATQEGNCEYAAQYYDCNDNCINDADQDNVCNELDNCPQTYNPNQLDLNNDGIGDDCDGVALDEDGQFEWNVYPNPLKDYTVIQFTNPTAKEYLIELIDLSGNIIYSTTSSNTSHKIENRFASGYYIIQLQSNQKIVRKTLIIE